MKAIAHRKDVNGLAHDLEIREHQLVCDEPADKGGDDQGPTPQELLAASLAACIAITIEMYARRKEWELGEVEVQCDYDQPDRGEPTLFKVTLRLPGGLTPDQVERLEVVAARCPVHRTLEGEARFEQQTELTEPAT